MDDTSASNLRRETLVLTSDRFKARFCAVGDSVIDYNRSLNRLFTGGNSYNFSILCKILGFDSAFMGVVGSDPEGQLIRGTLEGQGIDVSHLQVREGETGLCGIDLVGGERVIVNLNDMGVVKSQPFRFDPDSLSHLADYDLVHTSCFSYLEPEFDKIRQLGIPILYDASDTWKQAGLEELAGSVDYLFFSGKELGKAELRGLLKRLVTRDPCQMALTTIGERGALVYDGQEFYDRAPYFASAPIADSTGSGDYWLSGFMTTWIQGLKYLEGFERLPRIQEAWIPDPADQEDYLRKLLEQALSFANVMARFACMHQGTFGIGFPYDSEE